MTRKIFTDAFRKEAVQLALTSGLSRDQVAEDLGVGKSTLDADHENKKESAQKRGRLEKTKSRTGRNTR